MKIHGASRLHRQRRLRQPRAGQAPVPVRERQRTRQVLPFLLICLAGGAAALLQAGRQGVTLPPTGILLLGAVQIFCLWGLWHWRRMLPLLPVPPWRRAIDSAGRQQQHQRSVGTLTWCHLAHLQLRQAFTPPPAPPRPMRPPRLRMRRRAVARRRVAPQRRRLPLPVLDVQFVAPSRTYRLPIPDQDMQAGAVTFVQEALRQILPAAPAVLALHDEPRHIVCQLATTTILSGGQQREVVRMLQVHGFVTSWSDDALLSLRRESVASALPQVNIPPNDVLWVPVVRSRQGQIWWPLPRGQNLIIAGQAQGPLSGCIGRLHLLPDERRPSLLVYDPDRRLQELDDTLARLPTEADALAVARHAQLTARFARERRHGHAINPVPVLIVIAPTAAIWPDLYPLLAPDSGVQVVLVLGDREPLPGLRAVCHRLPVIEIPDPRYPALPDAFRPAGLASVSVGQALAWLPGGHTVWRGLPPLVQPTGSLTREEVV